MSKLSSPLTLHQCIPWLREVGECRHLLSVNLTPSLNYLGPLKYQELGATAKEGGTYNNQNMPIIYIDVGSSSTSLRCCHFCTMWLWRWSKAACHVSSVICFVSLGRPSTRTLRIHCFHSHSGQAVAWPFFFKQSWNHLSHTTFHSPFQPLNSSLKVVLGGQME